MTIPKKEIEENKQKSFDFHFIKTIAGLQQYYEGLVEKVMVYLNEKRNEEIKIGETICLVNLDEDRN